jgi:site-specific DNA recombinase
MNCVLYARVSTDKQAQKELSIPAQLSAMRQYAKSNAWRIIAEYVDEGESARSIKRPELQKLISFCKEKKGVDVVLVHKLDRMARNLPDYLAIKTELKRKGIRLVSVVEQFEDSVTGRLLENIIASISEWYSGNLGEEIKKAAQAKLQRGEWPIQPPLGYRSMRNEEKKVAHVEDPVTAPLVRQAFELYGTGQYSLPLLSEEMAERGLRTRHGKPCSAQYMKTLLSKLFYAGVLVWKGKEYQGKHPPLVSKELFYRVQRILAVRQARNGEKGRHRFLLRGIVHCKSCGQKMTAEIHPRGSYYRCPSHAYARKCDEPYIPARELDGQLEALYRDLQQPQETLELLRAEVGAIAQRRSEISEKEVFSLKQKLADIEAKETDLADRLVSKTLQKDVYDRLAERYACQRKEAEARLAQLDVDYRDPLDFLDKAAFAASFLHGLHTRFRYEQQKILLRAVFKRIEVRSRTIVSYELNPPFSFFLKGRQNGASPVFENPPREGTLQDIFEQLTRFTPPDEFIALLKVLDSLEDLKSVDRAKAA